jgi:hypothetical protein
MILEHIARACTAVVVDARRLSHQGRSRVRRDQSEFAKASKTKIGAAPLYVLDSDRLVRRNPRTRSSTAHNGMVKNPPPAKPGERASS